MSPAPSPGLRAEASPQFDDASHEISIVCAAVEYRRGRIQTERMGMKEWSICRDRGRFPNNLIEPRPDDGHLGRGKAKSHCGGIQTHQR